MKIQDLKLCYSAVELESWPGDNDLRYNAFSPILSDLFENKVVYYEKFIGIVSLKDIKITPESFTATAVPLIKIEKPFPYSYFPEDPWEFSAQWSSIMFSENSFHVPYAGWTIWPDPETVREAEQLVKKGDFEGALKLTLYPDED